MFDLHLVRDRGHARKTKMTLPFVEIYILAALCCLAILFTKPLDNPLNSLGGGVLLFAFVETVIGVIVNSIWIGQDVQLDIVLPIFLTALPLALILHLWARDSGFRLLVLKDAARYFDELISFSSELFEKITLIFLVILISSISFAVVKLNFDAISSSITGRHNINDILTINSYLFIISFSGLVVIKIVHIVAIIATIPRRLKKIMGQRKTRKQLRIEPRPGYDIRSCVHCASYSDQNKNCEWCHGAGVFRIKKPLKKCPRCKGSGIFTDYVIGSMIGKNCICGGRGWITE